MTRGRAVGLAAAALVALIVLGYALDVDWLVALAFIALVGGLVAYAITGLIGGQREWFGREQRRGEERERR